MATGEDLFFAYSNHRISPTEELSILNSLYVCLAEIISLESSLAETNEFLKSKLRPKISRLAKLSADFEEHLAKRRDKPTAFSDDAATLRRTGELIRDAALVQLDVEKAFSQRVGFFQKRQTVRILAGLLVLLLAAVALYGATGQDDYSVRVKGLESLRGALESYHMSLGAYPDTNGNWVLLNPAGKGPGAKTASQIIPAFLPSLPVYPGMDADSLKGYLYRSDGKDYKLIAHNVDDCAKARMSRAELLDPSRRLYGKALTGPGKWNVQDVEWELVPQLLEDKNRYDQNLCMYGDCFAYGFWTQNAAYW